VGTFARRLHLSELLDRFEPISALSSVFARFSVHSLLVYTYSLEEKNVCGQYTCVVCLLVVCGSLGKELSSTSVGSVHKF
jgi:hypothetical protein